MTAFFSETRCTLGRFTHEIFYLSTYRSIYRYISGTLFAKF